MVSKSSASLMPMRRRISRKIHQAGRLSKRGAIAWSRMKMTGTGPGSSARMLARSR